MKLRPDRVAHALRVIEEWRKLVQDQGSKHLLPLLALLEAKAGHGAEVLFNETPHEFAFWDRYFRLHDDDLAKPYFNPLTLKRAEAGFPHSNTATIRKNTFALKWQAASMREKEDGEHWTLAGDYAEIFRDKALRKGGVVSRAPVVDLAAVLFRNEDFPDGATAQTLQERFRDRFPQKDDDYGKLFQFVNEDASSVFQAAGDPPPDYERVIRLQLLQDVAAGGAAVAELPPPIALREDDPVLLQVQRLLQIGTSGVILKGPPGTGKTYQAKRIAKHLVADPMADVFRVQFHPSYGYEDFVEGYRPDDGAKSGFKIVPKTFRIACQRAKEVPGIVILIIDEINRGDPARVFGEVLTYIERSYRDDTFILPFSGEPLEVPRNLLLMGTMNPYDRSVSHVDAAFVRRFDHIEIPPSREAVEELLTDAGGFGADKVALVCDWFEAAQNLVPLGLGHSFFDGVKDVDHLKLVWRYRIKPTAEVAIELNQGALDSLTSSFTALVRRLEGASGGG